MASGLLTNGGSPAATIQGIWDSFFYLLIISAAGLFHFWLPARRAGGPAGRNEPLMTVFDSIWTFVDYFDLWKSLSRL